VVPALEGLRRVAAKPERGEKDEDSLKIRQTECNHIEKGHNHR
jgi:hypothetical protein